MAKVDLVFRQIHERTREFSLELAQQHIQPDQTFIIDNVRPFRACVTEMLTIEHQCDYVVYVDADCLILEDLREFIDRCDAPYVDAYVTDRFRGRLHCGVHITRIDLVRRMAEVEIPSDDLKYVLRPESRIRNLAMKPLGMAKQFRNFDILHDHFQSYHDIFMKYALRELRSRTKVQKPRLASAMASWKSNGGVDDFSIARLAVAYARAEVAKDAPPAEVDAFISALPRHAVRELARMDVQEKPPFERAELDAWRERNRDRCYRPAARKNKVFGLGLSRTGTRSLNHALQVLGYDCVHYPIDEDTYTELSNAQFDLTLLKYYDGLTDITVSPFYDEFDRLYPGSKFILTIRDQESWLRSCAVHWFNRPAFRHVEEPDEIVHLQMRQFLRSAVFGCYNFDPRRFTVVYNRFVSDVKRYFADRPEDLLVLDICNGEGFEKLAPFLGRPIPSEPFPHKGGVLSLKMLAGEGPKPLELA